MNTDNTDRIKKSAFISVYLRPKRWRLADVWAILALLVLVLLFFWKMVFSNLIIARGDLFNYFYPYRDFAAAAVRAGHIPLWNPHLFMGAPFLANSQIGIFYPPNVLLSWIDVTRAVNLNIVLHIVLAATGAYLFARRVLNVSLLAAWLGGVAFGLSGYLATQVEHLNQLQTLAWMPWVWLAYEWAAQKRSWLRSSGAYAIVGVVIAVMILAGHTQRVFIALVGLGVYAVGPALERWRDPRAALRIAVARLMPLVVAVLIGVALAAIQILPTLELSNLSPRGGGLAFNEAVSFSLDPRLLGHTLLPDYANAMPSGSEFTSFLSVGLLLLMIAGAHRAITQPYLRTMVVITFLGLFFAAGGFNPIYQLLVRFMPGFDLFRVPARWLGLFVFGASMLAALGLDGLYDQQSRRAWERGLLLIAMLIALTLIASNVEPAGASGPLGIPSILSLGLWIGAALIGVVLIVRRHSLLLVTLIVVELFVATRASPYNAHMTAPDALTSLRPPVAQLMISADDEMPSRFLSISDIFFDPGDSPELESIFADQLSADAFFDLIVATKAKEIVAPNLPLYYRLQAVDGFDGGILPLRNYLTLQRLFLPSEAILSDGRLREQLKSIPAARWLDLMNVKYVITDKVGDRWFDGVFYDLQFTTRLDAGQVAFTDQMPVLEANAFGLVLSDVGVDPIAQIRIDFVDGSTEAIDLTNDQIEPIEDTLVARVHWSEAKRVAAVTMQSVSGLTLHGAALIDERSNTFHSFVLTQEGRFRLAHSGDVKVYEHVDVLPRAYVVHTAQFANNDEQALDLMSSAHFDPSKSVVLNQPEPNPKSEISNLQSPVSKLQSQVKFITYEPEHIIIEVNTASVGYLVLSDAWYPGWTATIDGAAVEVERANVYFRAVPIEAGTHRVEFRFEPQSVHAGLLISLSTLGLIVIVLAGGLIIHR